MNAKPKTHRERVADTQGISGESGVEMRYVYAEIVYRATKMTRELA